MKIQRKPKSVVKKSNKEQTFSKYYILAFLAGIISMLAVMFRYKDMYILSDINVSTVKCSDDYKGEGFEGCLPTKCGRVFVDNLVNSSDVNILLSIAKKGFKLAGGSGGASILDLHSGALSHGDKFINFYKMDQAKDIFTEVEINVYRNVKELIKAKIIEHFGLTSDLYLTHPTFFSRMDNTSAVTQHDEYWHPHVDKLQYQTFHYTSLIYLTTYGDDFKGGRFVFVDEKKESFIEPRFGRISFFTSGKENVHNVEKVVSGTRYALTIPFSCNPDYKIKDPVL